MRPEQEAAVCATCRERGRTGYCAPKRCYCGHEACPAFASFVDMSKVPFAEQAPPTGRRR